MSNEETHSHIAKSQLSERLYYLIFLGGMVALAPLSIDAYMPAIPAIANEFGSPVTLVNLTISIFLLGMAVGQVFGGPLSDQYGRRNIGLFGLGLYLIFTLLICFASNVLQILSLRFLQAIGAGFAGVICLAQIHDVFPASVASKKIANVMLVMLIAPVIGPMLGALLSQNGWRSIFIMLLIISMILLITYILMVPETLAASRRSSKSFSNIFLGYHSVVTQKNNGKRLALWYSLFHGASFGVFICYLTSITQISMSIYGLSEFAFALLFGVNSLFLISGNRIAKFWLNRISSINLVRRANLAQIILLFMLSVSASLINLPLSVFSIGIAALMICQAALNPSIAGAYIALFGHDAGVASAWFSTMQFGIGAIMGSVAAVVSIFINTNYIALVFIAMLASSLLARIFLSIASER